MTEHQSTAPSEAAVAEFNEWWDTVYREFALKDRHAAFQGAMYAFERFAASPAPSQQGQEQLAAELADAERSKAERHRETE